MRVSLDPSIREQAIEAGWRAYESQVPGMEAAYRRVCESWQVVGVKSGDECIGALFAKDGVIHLGIVPEHRNKWASRRIIREMLAYGDRTTIMQGQDETFIRRIGFKQSGGEFRIGG